jgi:hypothetical protein
MAFEYFCTVDKHGHEVPYNSEKAYYRVYTRDSALAGTVGPCTQKRRVKPK